MLIFDRLFHLLKSHGDVFLTMFRTAITRMRAVVVMVRTSRSQGLLVTMIRDEVGNQERGQKEPFLPC